MDLLDANTLITANNTYYPIDAVPEFWHWLEHQCQAGAVKVPSEIMEEIEAGGQTPGNDSLCDWLKQGGIRDTLLLAERVDPSLVRAVVNNAYAPDLTETEVEKIGRDPFLVAYGLAAAHQRCVVTAEVSAPAKKRAKVKVPNACDTMGVKWCGPFALYRRLNFTTSWRPPTA
jgi:hypothetical protein